MQDGGSRCCCGSGSSGGSGGGSSSGGDLDLPFVVVYLTLDRAVAAALLCAAGVSWLSWHAIIHEGAT